MLAVFVSSLTDYFWCRVGPLSCSGWQMAGAECGKRAAETKKATLTVAF